ncbi:MAG: sialate O-acetylesterase [Chthoniobacteraceae bacterium]
MTSRPIPQLVFASICASALCFAPPLQADVKLPALISDHMVLQQEAQANVWGTAEPGEKVTVKLAGFEAAATADDRGDWNVRILGVKAGPAGDMTIQGSNTLTVKDVMMGEVWVCSGQSNMEFAVSGANDAATEIAAAKYPEIRLFTVPRLAAEEATREVRGEWKICSPETVGSFSAVAYFFGRDLFEKLKVPIGLIHSSWGGTGAELWTPEEVIAAVPSFKERYQDRWEQIKTDYPKAKETYDRQMDEWKVAAEKAKADGQPSPRQPGLPKGGTPEGSPGSLFNGMIVPLLPYTIQGAIWYQGESNAGDAKLYRSLFPMMIRSWRAAWSKGGLGASDNPDFPFLYVQLANFMARHDQPGESAWAELREAQLLTLQLPRTAMAVAIDIGEEKDIHPKNKQEVGRRLALGAEATVYYLETEYSGPIIAGSQPEGDHIRLSFRHGQGMKAADGGEIKGFSIAGQDGKFVWAQVEIDGDHVLVSSSEVKEPVAVRYGWADNPEGNLVNEAGLPASPFRTDGDDSGL